MKLNENKTKITAINRNRNTNLLCLKIWQVYITGSKITQDGRRVSVKLRAKCLK